MDNTIAENSDQLGVEIASHTTDSFSFLTRTLAVIFGFLIVPFWLFYALRDRHRFEDNFGAAVPVAVRPDIFNGIRIADALLGRYLRGQLILGAVVGVLTFIGLTLIDVELSIALAIFAGISELIPIIGPWIGALPALLMAAASGDPEKILWVALLFVMVQQLENNLLVPRIQSQAVDLHPAIIILLLVAAGAVFGFIGLLVIVPLTALLREIFWYADSRLRGLEPDAALAESHAARHLHLKPPDEPPEQPPGAEPAEGDGAAAASSD
ncbi:MAG: AI-2E family transporter [Chloroflexi bacterium]|nr:AI-2E family transporter [Chloroflexota bacterium]